MGEWIGRLTDWTHLATFTHDGRRLSEGHTLVGVTRHHRVLREWWDQDVLRFDPTAQLWHETEFYESGQVHGHAVCRFAPNAPTLRIREAWYRRAGFMRLDEVGAGVELVASYITKRCGVYVAKRPVVVPFVRGIRPRELVGLALPSMRDREGELWRIGML